MITNKINNAREFKIYVILFSILFCIGFTIGVISIISIFTGDWTLINSFDPSLKFGFVTIIIVLGLIELVIRPSYIETIINEDKILIRVFSPNKGSGIRYLWMLGYKKYIKEYVIARQEYNDYKLYIAKFGFRKTIVLQKIDKNGIYETKPINISLLGQKKYTELILSIDRLKGKINLN